MMSTWRAAPSLLRLAAIFIVVAALAAASFVVRNARAEDSTSVGSEQYSTLADPVTPTGLTIVSPDQARSVESSDPTALILVDSPSMTHVDVATVRPVHTTAPGARTWLAASTDGGICILVWAEGLKGPASSCTSPSGREHGPFLQIPASSVTRGKAFVSGAVPDGVGSVTIASVDGTASTINVEQNAYTAEVSAPAMTIRFANGERNQVIHAGGSNL